MRKLALLATVVSLLSAAILIGCSQAVEEPGGTAEEMREDFDPDQPGGSPADPGAADAEEELGP